MRYTERVEAARRNSDVIRWNGEGGPSSMAYEWGLAGPDGGWFVLLPEEYHTKGDIKRAKSELRMDQDVVRLGVAKGGDKCAVSS